MNNFLHVKNILLYSCWNHQAAQTVLETMRWWVWSQQNDPWTCLEHLKRRKHAQTCTNSRESIYYWLYAITSGLEPKREGREKKHAWTEADWLSPHVLCSWLEGHATNPDPWPRDVCPQNSNTFCRKCANSDRTPSPHVCADPRWTMRRSFKQ